MENNPFTMEEPTTARIRGSELHREGHIRLYNKAGYLVITHTIDPRMMDPRAERDTGQTLCIELEANKENEELIQALESVLSFLTGKTEGGCKK